ncbi:hypothetical protein LJC15_01635 [Desulfovibrio sp. OttesenSCG-928-G11]|nr:hypothetical protein [Desulfovibrio sp. OttesenSCG-928-G11]
MQTQYLLKNIYLDIFCCPICRTALQSHSQEGTEQGIVNGYFFCRSCAAYYPILEGIPFFFAQPVWEKLMTNDERCKALSLLEGKHSADTPAPSARQLLAGSNWEYQFGDAFAVTQQALADPENFWGEKAFFSFCGLTPPAFF